MSTSETCALAGVNDNPTAAPAIKAKTNAKGRLYNKAHRCRNRIRVLQQDFGSKYQNNLESLIQQLAQRVDVRRARDASLGDYGCDISVGRDVEGRIRDVDTCGRDLSIT